MRQVLGKIFRIFKIIILEVRHIFTHLIIYYPASPIGDWFRGVYYRNIFKTTDIPKILRGTKFNHSKLIQLGENFVAGEKVVIDAGDSSGIFIGNNVSIAQCSYIRSANHVFDNVDIFIQDQGHTSKKIIYNNKVYSIIIKDDVWIGASCIILTGAELGEGSILAAGAVVSHKIPPYSIVVGNPGRVVLKRGKKS